MTTPAKRLCLLKFGSIGDVVMAIPAAAAMHAAGYTVDWVASNAVTPLLQLYPWINVLPVDEPQLLRGTLPQRLRHTLQLWQTLRNQPPYDTVATLYYDPRYRLLTLPLTARRRLSLSHTDRRFELLPGRHHTDEYARLLLGRPDAATPHQLAPVPPPQLPPSPLPPDPHRTRIVLVPAGARNVLRDDALRRWPIELYVTLAAELLQQGHEVVLLGGADDRWASPHFAPLAVTDLIGQLTLVQTLGLFGSAVVTVTHDTGPLHLAGLTSTAILALFGPTDPHGRLPRRPNAVALWGGEGFACRPCYDGRDYAPCPQNDCLRQLTPAFVLAQIDTLLDTHARSQTLPPRILTPEPTPFVQVQPPSLAPF